MAALTISTAHTEPGTRCGMDEKISCLRAVLDEAVREIQTKHSHPGQNGRDHRCQGCRRGHARRVKSGCTRGGANAGRLVTEGDQQDDDEFDVLAEYATGNVGDEQREIVLYICRALFISRVDVQKRAIRFGELLLRQNPVKHVGADH